MFKKKNKALFFGRKNCEYTNRAIQKLKSYGWIVKICLTNSRNKKLTKNLLNWEGDFIFSFRSYIIIPSNLLLKAKKAAINFHPSSPKYRGSGGMNLALYNNDNQFGCTAHLMNEKIDSGSIILTNKFKIGNEDNINNLPKKTYESLLMLFFKIISGIHKKDLFFIKNSIKNSKNIKWGKKLHKINEIDKLQKIKFNYSENKIKNIIRSTHTKKYPVFIDLHGIKFILEE